MSPTPAQIGLAPDWVVAEMPPGYQTRYAEIQRLSAEIHAMDRMGRLLWESGAALAEAVREAFSSLKFDVEPSPESPFVLGVKIDGRRRLFVRVSETDGTIQKKSDEVAQAFRLIHEVAGEDDRVVLVAAGDRVQPPKIRPDAIVAEAATLLRRMGANVLPTPALFALWSLSLKDASRARAAVEQLHAQDGGVFVLPAQPA